MLRDTIRDKHILIVGDVMLDSYYQGDVNRISPEAPVPVFRKKDEWNVLGGAANVAMNLIASGQKVSVMSRIGSDLIGDRVLSIFAEKGVNTELVMKTQKKTIQKTRFLAANNQQVMRLDVEDTTPLTDEECEAFLDELRNRILAYDLVVVSDYLKGFMTKELTQGVIRLANDNGIRVIVDVKDKNYSKYSGAFLLKPNQNELSMLSGMPVSTMEEIEAATAYLLDTTKVSYILTTLGAKGMLLSGIHQEKKYIKSVGKEVFDVTGAGDTTIAYLAACIANGMAVEDAMEIANYAAGIQIAKVGTSAVSIQEVDEYLAGLDRNHNNKIMGINSVERFRRIYNNKKIVFTNGCFDILHVGHVRYLQEAAGLGDILVVGLNSDESVRRLKGAERPVNSEADRAEILASLKCVSYVVIFEEDTPYNLIEKLQPDVLVKGSDYKPEEVVGKDIVEARGGCLKLISFVEGKSTTNIIKKMRG